MDSSSVGSVGRGLRAGLVATIALSILIVVQRALGILPGLNLVTILARALGSDSPTVGWIAHYVVGVIFWGLLFSWLDRKMFFAHWINGLLFASGVWLGVMLVVMPIAGEGAFGLRLGLVIPTVTLFLHWIYGIVLGTVYGAWTPGAWTESHRLRHV